MRKVMVVVDSRATWSRARTVCEEIQKRDDLELQLVRVGPASLEPHSLTQEPFVDIGITRPKEWSMARLTGEYIAELSFEIAEYRPDVVVSVTDRHESLAVAVTASLSNVLLAHIQGGEVSGSNDESIRHAITKLSNIHFPANEDSRERIIKMGENPRFVFNVGCPATDLLLKVDIGPNPVSPYVLVSYNPVTNVRKGKNFNQMQDILDSCNEAGLLTIIIGPNHDPGNEEVNDAIHRWMGCSALVHAVVHDSLPHTEFIKLLAHASVLVGNSSAGIREACYFGTPVVNVGDRQFLRACTRNVITVPMPTKERAYSSIVTQLRRGRFNVECPYGNGGAGEKIAEILATIELPSIQKTITY